MWKESTQSKFLLLLKICRPYRTTALSFGCLSFPRFLLQLPTSAFLPSPPSLALNPALRQCDALRRKPEPGTALLRGPRPVVTSRAPRSGSAVPAPFNPLCPGARPPGFLSGSPVPACPPASVPPVQGTPVRSCPARVLSPEPPAPAETSGRQACGDGRGRACLAPCLHVIAMMK